MIGAVTDTHYALLAIAMVLMVVSILVPLAERFSLYASAGAVRLSGDSTLGGQYYGGFAGSSISRAVNAARLGLGLQYQFSNSLGLRFDVERYRALGTNQLGAFDADNVSLGVSVKF